MPASIYMKSISLGANWVPLAEQPTVLTVTLITGGTTFINDPVDIRANGGDTVKLPLGIAIRLEGVDLSVIETRGESGTRLAVIGHSR